MPVRHQRSNLGLVRYIPTYNGDFSSLFGMEISAPREIKYCTIHVWPANATKTTSEWMTSSKFANEELVQEI
jgi:hypothetical protein